jgi:hypothetical protein
MTDSSMDAIQTTLGITGALAEILLGLCLILILYIVFSVSEFIYNNVATMWRDRVELFPDTYPSGGKMYTAIQNPSNKDAKTIWFSDNQRSGVEFSFSLFINIASDTFSRGDHKLYHILHKGYSNPYPLLGPGIFCWGDTNKVRVYMNCYDTWDNFVDVENIPVNKWFHMTVSCKGNTLYVYINGNLKKKMVLTNNTPPYQNFGNVYAFNPRTISLTKSITLSLEKDPEFVHLQGNNVLSFDGSAKGMISRVYYFGYALTYTEIQALMNMGPSPNIQGGGVEVNAQLSDTWWANNQGP